MLSAQRSWPACFSLKPSFLDEEWLGVRERGPEEEKWEKDHLRQNVTLRSRIGGFNHSLSTNTQASHLPVRFALPCPALASLAVRGRGGARVAVALALGRCMVHGEASSWFDFLHKYHIFFFLTKQVHVAWRFPTICNPNNSSA